MYPANQSHTKRYIYKPLLNSKKNRSTVEFSNFLSLVLTKNKLNNKQDSSQTQFTQTKHVLILQFPLYHD